MALCREQRYRPVAYGSWVRFSVDYLRLNLSALTKRLWVMAASTDTPHRSANSPGVPQLITCSSGISSSAANASACHSESSYTFHETGTGDFSNERACCSTI